MWSLSDTSSPSRFSSSGQSSNAAGGVAFAFLAACLDFAFGLAAFSALRFSAARPRSDEDVNMENFYTSFKSGRNLVNVKQIH